VNVIGIVTVDARQQDTVPRRLQQHFGGTPHLRDRHGADAHREIDLSVVEPVGIQLELLAQFRQQFIQCLQ
jgi:hypothetical protein